MVLEKDQLNNNGLLILKEGTVLTETWIERLGNFARFQSVTTLVPVRIEFQPRSFLRLTFEALPA